MLTAAPVCPRPPTPSPRSSPSSPTASRSVPRAENGPNHLGLRLTALLTTKWPESPRTVISLWLRHCVCADGGGAGRTKETMQPCPLHLTSHHLFGCRRWWRRPHQRDAHSSSHALPFGSQTVVALAAGGVGLLCARGGEALKHMVRPCGACTVHAANICYHQR